MRKQSKEILERWRARYNRWKASGLNATEFSRKEGVHPDTFREWRKKFDASKESNNSLIPSDFVEIVPGTFNINKSISTLSLTQIQPIEIIVNNKFHLRIPAQFDSSSLRKIIEILETK